jgi:hypothetical protein
VYSVDTQLIRNKYYNLVITVLYGSEDRTLPLLSIESGPSPRRSDYVLHDRTIVLLGWSSTSPCRWAAIAATRYQLGDYWVFLVSLRGGGILVYMELPAVPTPVGNVGSVEIKLLSLVGYRKVVKGTLRKRQERYPEPLKVSTQRGTTLSVLRHY